jgi:hypothetical protein
MIAFIRTMWALLWTAFLRPFTNTKIDASTGEIINEEPS